MAGPFEGLNPLIQQNASSLALTRADDGKIKSDSSVTMTFGSGLRRAFRVGILPEHQETNRASLKVLLDYIEEKSSAKVRSHVEAGITSLAASTDVTVADRIKRGTYVSSELVAQIKQLAIEGHRLETHAINAEMTHSFLTRTGGGERCGLIDLIDELARDEGGQWPSQDYANAWQEMRRYFQDATAPGHPELERLAQLRQNLARLESQANAQGRTLTPEEVKQAASRYLTANLTFFPFVNVANQRQVDRITEDRSALAGLVRDLASHVDPSQLGDITAEDCALLARQLEHDETLDLPETGILGRALRLLWEEPGEQEDRDIVTILNKMAASIREQHAATREQRHHVRDMELAQLRDFLRDYTNPKEYGPGDFARMITPIVKPILTELHRRRDEIDGQGAANRRQAREQFERRVGTYEKLGEIAAKTPRGLYSTSKGPDSARGFVEALVMKPILDATYRSYPPPKGNPSDRDMAENAVRTTQEVWTDQFARVLPVLDEFADFQHDIERLGPGGLARADRKTLTRLDNEAGRIRDQVEHLRNLGQVLGLKYQATPVLEVADALRKAADRIEAGLDDYWRQNPG